MMVLPTSSRSDTRRRGWTDMLPVVSRKTLVIVAAAAATTLFLLAASNRADWSVYSSPTSPPKTDPHAPHPGSNAIPAADGSGPEITVARVDIPIQPTATSYDLPTWPTNTDTTTDVPIATATPSSAPDPARAGQPVTPYALDDVCDAFPGVKNGNILLVMKTGASEAFARVPTQLMTLLKCLPDFLIFSDMDQDVAGYHILDSLDNVTASVMEGNSDFDLYRRQKACLVDIASCNKLGDPAGEGWQLDKYKNVHMAEKAYRMKPGFDWYLFIDADTYVMWPNMVEWLATMKPSYKHYLGTVSMVNDFPFAHGGSGYVVSQAAMKELITKNPGIGTMYDRKAYEECCGDFVFGMALKEKAGVAVQQVYPMLNGDKPTTIPFGGSHWCHVVSTMHHLNSEEIDTFWKFEHDFYADQLRAGVEKPRPLLAKDMFLHYLAPRLGAKLEDWDNKSEDTMYFNVSDTSREWEEWQIGRMKKHDKYNDKELRAHLSVDDCMEACKSLPADDCFQWKYADGICYTRRAISLGNPIKAKDEGKRMTSGWDVDKIHKWVADQGECTKIWWPEVEEKEKGWW
ncbi:glycoprotein-N-acetylgalactosamine 3-beta-galactosyltransferase 1 [Podospora conica]|nr:glycoprotein-N-acetylgalactosamine 3-beta-galactosyltransferase 1 [Schizothecium conicum]